MRIISKSKVREFVARRMGNRNAAEKFFSAWLKIVAARESRWANFAALRDVFPSADQVGDCVVFDVGVFRYRLVAFVRYATEDREGIVYVRKIMDHAEYDKKRWIDECGCRKPRPSKPIALNGAKPPGKGRKP